jgi:hypothetical protein
LFEPSGDTECRRHALRERAIALASDANHATEGHTRDTLIALALHCWQLARRVRA